MTDSAPEAALFAAVATKQGYRRHVEPDWTEVHRDRKRKHVTRAMLWNEYIECHPGGYRYSRFCELYRTAADDDAADPRRRRQAVCRLRRRHGASDHRSAHWQDPTGAFFSRCLASPVSLTRGELDTGAQRLDRRLYHGPWRPIGGVPGLLVPDNTKVTIIKACLYEPRINRTYAEMAAHYDTAILPARPRRPHDKAKVEVAVLLIERWLLGRLRHRRFYGLAELNAAIVELGDSSTKSARSAGSASLAEPCPKESIGPTSSGCPPSPIALPNGACAASASITTSSSTLTFIVFCTASRAARSRRG
jgi:hypothetical protein